MNSTLITTFLTSSPLHAESPSTLAIEPAFGPFEPGLDPMETILPPFANVIDYRHYCLRDTSAVPGVDELRGMHRLKARVDGLHLTLGFFDGFTPIRFLPFLFTLKDALNALGKSEGISVRILAYFLKHDAKNAYEAHINPGTPAPPSPRPGLM